MFFVFDGRPRHIRRNTVSENSELKRIDGHRLTEFIYGTVIALVALLGIDAGHASVWQFAVFDVAAGGVAIWLAHAYSTLMSNRMMGGRRIDGPAICKALWGSRPIISAAILISLPFLGVAVSLYDMQTALVFANTVGVLILAIVGFLAGVSTGESWMRRIILVFLSIGIGLFVIAAKLIIHR